jgi:hypothetical protein
MSATNSRALVGCVKVSYMSDREGARRLWRIDSWLSGDSLIAAVAR